MTRATPNPNATIQTLADATLTAYEQLGRELPDDVSTWTPKQSQQMRAARDAYYAALKARNAS